MSTSESTPGGDELAELRRRGADLQAACEKAQQNEAVMRLAIAGLRRELIGRLSVLVPLVGLMLLEAKEHEHPLTLLEDLARLQRNLERLCRAADVVGPVDEPDGGELFDLNAVLRETVAVGAGQLTQRGIRVQMALDERLPPVHGNPVALGQALMSLLTSARDPVTATGVVWVETTCTDQPAGVRLVVRDDGDGVPDAVRTIFAEPFLVTGPESAGHRLSIARRIVESHAGTIELRSHTGAGTTWIVWLPGRNGHGADP
jgi:signal transduction histidine kinase